MNGRQNQSNGGADQFDLDDFLPFRLNRAAEWASLRFASIYRKRYGMTRPEWRTLANLGQYGKLTAKEICTLSTQHKTKVSRAVTALENRRWLKREQNPDDRREEWLELTPAGRNAYADLAALGMQCDRDLEKLLGVAGTRALQQGLGAVEKAMASGKGLTDRNIKS